MASRNTVSSLGSGTLARLGNLSITSDQLAASKQETAGAAEPILRSAEVATSMFHAPGTDKKPGAALSGLFSFFGITAGLVAGNEAAKVVPTKEFDYSAPERWLKVLRRAIPPIFAAIGGIVMSNFFYKEREFGDLASPNNVLGLTEKSQNIYGRAVTKVSTFANTQGASGGIRLLGFNGWFNSAMFSLRQYVTVAFPGLNKLLSGVNDYEATGPLTMMNRLIGYCTKNPEPNYERIRYYCDGVLTRITDEKLPVDRLSTAIDKMALEFYSIVQSFRGEDGKIKSAELDKFLTAEFGGKKVDELVFGKARTGVIESALKPGDKGYNHRATWGGLGLSAEEIATTPKGWIGATAKPLLVEAKLKEELTKVKADIKTFADNARTSVDKLMSESLGTQPNIRTA